VLFLGAGASRPMNIDDLSGITLKVKESVTPTLKRTIEQLEEIFDANQNILGNFKPDIEVLLTVFDCLVNRKRMLNELGPFPLLMHHFTENISEFRNLAIPKEQFQQFNDLVLSTITQAICGYNQDQERKKRAMKLYDEIYNIPIRNDHQFPNATGGTALQIFSFVATVNYDLVLEIYGRQTKVAGVPKFFKSRGFVEDNGIEVLNIPGIMERSNNPNYIKLHGSIDWWLDASQRVTSSIVGQENPFVVLKERTIIYPIYEKHITRDPFFTLYEYFRRTLLREDIVIVIGYSFRDLTINNAFLDWLASKPESRLIITAKKKNHEVIRRIINNDNDKKNDKIQFIDKHFGEAGFITDLENTLNNNIL
jgi:hypothetical protein